MSKVKEWGISVIRTSLVPPLAGWILKWMIDHGITNIEAGQVTLYVTLGLSFIWYSILRLVEMLAKSPRVVRWAGILLGFPKSPDYNDLALKVKSMRSWSTEGGTHSEVDVYVKKQGKIVGEFTTNAEFVIDHFKQGR